MDTREKFNIKQMVDCENQEPFYPATHAEAVKIIDEGQIKNLQDIIGIILEFIRNFENVDLTDLLQLGHTSTTAFPGNEGVKLQEAVRDLQPVDEVMDGEMHPVTSNAVYDYVYNLHPDGEINNGDTRPVSGDTVYDYIQTLLNGIIEEGNPHLVTGGDIYNYVSSLQPNGNIEPDEDRAVSGGKIFEALQSLEDNFWETDSNYLGSLKQKPAEEQDLGLVVSNNNEVAIGKYNISNADTLFSVGSGVENNPINSIEVTSNPDDSLKVPYNGTPVSIQEHMRNGQYNILHLNKDDYDRLKILIGERWKADWSFSVSASGSEYLHRNQGIKLQWHITDSEGKPKNTQQESNNVLITTSQTYLKQNGKSEPINYTIQNPWDSHILNDYIINNNSLEFNFSDTGKTQFSFKMYLLTNEITPQQEKSASTYLYAPSYIFSNFNPNISSIPNDATAVQCAKLENFSASITIDPQQQQDEYIYIAVPEFIGIQSPTQDNQPFQVVGQFEFNLQNGLLRDTSKTFTVCNKSGIIVNYKIVRSAERLNYGIQWNIQHK